MPRVVTDQKTKFETDELFKKLSQDMDVGLWLAITALLPVVLCVNVLCVCVFVVVAR